MYVLAQGVLVDTLAFFAHLIINIMHSNAIQCMQCKAMRCKAMQSKAMQSKVKTAKQSKCKAKQSNAMQSKAMQSKAMQINVMQIKIDAEVFIRYSDSGSSWRETLTGSIPPVQAYI